MRSESAQDDTPGDCHAESAAADEASRGEKSRLDLAVEQRLLNFPDGARNVDAARAGLDTVEDRAAALAALHPGNRHVRPKIRQQLQILRDLGSIEFLAGGRYQAL